jgi:hypothetical protein
MCNINAIGDIALPSPDRGPPFFPYERRLFIKGCTTVYEVLNRMLQGKHSFFPDGATARGGPWPPL